MFGPDHVSGVDAWVDPVRITTFFIICTCLRAPDSIFSHLRDGNIFHMGIGLCFNCINNYHVKFPALILLI